MTITRRDFLGAVAFAAAAFAPTVAMAAESHAEVVSLEAALNRIGPDGFMVSLQRYLSDHVGFGSGWTGHYLTLFTPAVQAAYARGPVTLEGLEQAITLPYLIEAANDGALPLPISSSAREACMTIPGFDPACGMDQSQTTMDQHGCCEMSVRRALYMLKAGGDAAARDLLAGNPDWAALEHAWLFGHQGEWV